jgi:hypothetical protein
MIIIGPGVGVIGILQAWKKEILGNSCFRE